ncbi:pseudouridine synthase [Nocardioides sp. GY 10127]|uniref:pseudouridine synthase n=1 Tax=Nocardioides sp. GY 10127 TaxID=2569762 RepID=UPI0010A86F5D|nr:pseudouridine synthase [Nocardioides sp. GY 10127]TIC79279.1 pseudouridylate synthase [Nocardioides sp. GY 10127]
MPRSPLPPRHGLQAAWVVTPHANPERPAPWRTIGEWLRDAVDDRVDVEAMLAAGRFVGSDGEPVDEQQRYRPQVFVWFHRELREEPVVPGELVVVHRDERIVVLDKPPFLSTVPRGNHVVQSLVVRAREELGLPDLTTMHRLDRVTSGLVLCTVGKGWRAEYQSMFAAGTVRKTYRALAPYLPGLEEPLTVRNHIAAIPRTGRAHVVPDAPVNAETLVELEERRGDLAVYRLSPRTGRTHQLRLHLRDLGAPIVDDPLYPVDLHVDIDDFSRPLQLLASELAFTDPVDGTARHLVSPRSLPLTSRAGEERGERG